MPALRDVIVEIPPPGRLPWLLPGVRVSLCFEPRVDRSASRRRTCRIALPRKVRRRSTKLRAGPDLQSGRRAVRVRARILQSQRPNDSSAALAVTCRLTAFVHAPDVVHRRARDVTRSELRVLQREVQQLTATREIPRSLRLLLLLRLQHSRHLTPADRRHPVLAAAWHAFVRAERRRMLSRLRHAVRRLQERSGVRRRR